MYLYIETVTVGTCSYYLEFNFIFAVLLAKHARDVATVDLPGPLGVRNAALGTVRTVGPSEILLVELRTGAVVSRLPPGGSYPPSPASAAMDVNGEAPVVEEDIGHSDIDGAVEDAGFTESSAAESASGDSSGSDSESEEEGALSRSLHHTPSTHCDALSRTDAAKEAMFSVSYMRYDEGTGVLATGTQRGAIHLWQ